MTVASKPPINRKTSTGITTAISASDCPRCRRPPRWFLISVALRRQPDVGHGGRSHRSQRREEAGLPGVCVVNRDPEEVAGSVAYVAGCRRVGGGGQSGSIERIAVVVAGVRRQVAVPVLVEFVDIDLGHRVDLRGPRVFQNHRRSLVYRGETFPHLSG